MVYNFIWCLFLAEIWFQKNICLENLGESISSLCFQEIFMWHRTFLWQLEIILFSKASRPEAIWGKYFFFFFLCCFQFLYVIALWKKVKVKVAQSCLTLWDPMDYTVHGILQARILKWVAVCFSKGSSQPRDWTQVSHIAGRFSTS